MLDVNTSVREAVAAWFIAQMEQASQEKRERIIRLLIQRLPRYVVDGLFIAQELSSDDSTAKE